MRCQMLPFLEELNGFFVGVSFMLQMIITVRWLEHMHAFELSLAEL
jgi:hypothetical protein